MNCHIEKTLFWIGLKTAVRSASLVTTPLRTGLLRRIGLTLTMHQRWNQPTSQATYMTSCEGWSKIRWTRRTSPQRIPSRPWCRCSKSSFKRTWHLWQQLSDFRLKNELLSGQRTIWIPHSWRTQHFWNRSFSSRVERLLRCFHSQLLRREEKVSQSC